MQDVKGTNPVPNPIIDSRGFGFAGAMIISALIMIIISAMVSWVQIEATVSTKHKKSAIPRQRIRPKFGPSHVRRPFGPD